MVLDFSSTIFTISCICIVGYTGRDRIHKTMIRFIATQLAPAIEIKVNPGIATGVKLSLVE